MSILITGATGFVGQHLAKKIAEKNQLIYALVRNGRTPNLPKHFIPITGDLRQAEWSKNIPKIETVIHLAGLVHSHDNNDFYKINTEGTSNLIDSLKSQFDTLNFIQLSSLASTGPGDLLQKKRSESDRATPICDYGKSKLYADEYLLKNAPKTWKKIVLRPPIITGANDLAMKDVYYLALKGHDFKVKEYQRPRSYSFICIHDLVDIILLCIDKMKSNQSIPEELFVAYQQTFGLGELNNLVMNINGIKKRLSLSVPLSILKVVAKLNKKTRWLPHDLKKITEDKVKELNYYDWTCDNSKSVQSLDYQYQWDLKRTIENAISSYH